MPTPTSGGPLAGLRIVEFAGLGPAPFAATLLADLGADVVRIARPSKEDLAQDVTLRSRRTVYLHLKEPAHVETAKSLAQRADVLIEGFRPGVMERLGLGPVALHTVHPALVYARMTGWGQDGPRALAPGHDINYVALTGALHAMRSRHGGMVPPLNLVGDFGGGGMYLVMGILAAIFEARTSGKGQVVDCAICDGVVSMLGLFHHLRQSDRWRAEAQSNELDGGAPFYAAYECADGKYLSLGALEPKFYAALREKAGLTDAVFDEQWEPSAWPLQRERLAALMKTRSRDAWMREFEGVETCVAPVLDLEESLRDPHLQARRVFIDVQGRTQPAPAPRFSRTPATATPGRAVGPAEVLATWPH